MNRRMFMKSVGMATLFLTAALLSSCTPTPKTEIMVDRSHCPCPACQAGLPTKELHWTMPSMRAVIINDKAVVVVQYAEN